jgi:hypothetical protein
MGALTRLQIITEGAMLAGVEPNSVLARARMELNLWLRSQYDGYLWPFLRREKDSIALATGADNVILGAGVGGISTEIQRINDPIKIYTSDLTVYDNIRVSTDWDAGHPALSDLYSGRPETARVLADSAVAGKWGIGFSKKADRDYLLIVSYYARPAFLGKDDDIPLYPNDRTMVQHINAYCLKYRKAENYVDEAKLTQAMVLEDRLKYGSMPGVNDTLTLDSRIFR